MNNKNQNLDFGRFDFVKLSSIFGSISIATFLLAILYFLVAGVNWGIDFRGGTEIQIRFQQQVAIDDIKKNLESIRLGEFGVQGFSGEQSEYLIRFQTEKLATEKETNEALNKKIESVRESLLTGFANQGPEVRRVDTVGPQVGSDLKRSSALAVFYSLLIILIYIALRFDYKYAPGAVACLFHDAFITLALFSALGKEINVPAVAAILTLLGFSLNDTIVVFDRMRETEEQYRLKGTAFIINRALNDMLGRTLKTSVSVCISAMCLYFIAGGAVADIALTIFMGIIIGTYSSVYVAAPLVIVVEKLMSTAPNPRGVRV